MKILAIETSCDDTSCAVVNEKKQILSNIVQSQINVHSKYYGIVPEVASRHHVENINFIVESALSEAKCSLNDIDAIAVTNGPGLAGSLLVGIMTAKTYGYILNKPVIPINHLKAHVWANFLEYNNKIFIPEFPAIVLLVSGGHTELLLMNSFEDIIVLGRTRDDAAGEAFDKVGKLLDLGYPGGPVIDKIGRETKDRINMPRPYLGDTYDFSFSGLKTCVLNHTKKYNRELTLDEKHVLAASFQDAVVDVLVRKSINAAKNYNAKTILVSGGVACNSHLREKLVVEAKNITTHFPEKVLCTDNAAMAGALAVDMFGTAPYLALSQNFINVLPNIDIYGNN
jgi:N6-L-threonylcarbamoyladenine synthase